MNSSGTLRGGFVPISIYPNINKSFKSISSLKFGAKRKSHTLLIKLSVTKENAVSQSTLDQVKAQLKALQREAEETRAKANSTRARFMRLTEAVDNLQLQALADIKAGNDYAAKEMLVQKRKVMQTLEKSKRRTELLDELLTKLGEAISGKEAQLMKILASDRFEKDIGKQSEGPVRVVSSTEDTSVAQDLREHLSLDPDSKKSDMDAKAMRTDLTSHDEFQNQKIQEGNAKEFFLGENKIRDDQFLAVFRGIDSYQDFLIDLDRSIDEMELKLLTLLKFSSLLLENEEDRLTNQKNCSCNGKWKNVNLKFLALHIFLQYIQGYLLKYVNIYRVCIAIKIKRNLFKMGLEKEGTLTLANACYFTKYSHHESLSKIGSFLAVL